MAKPIVPEKTVQAQIEQLLDYGRWTWFHPLTALTFKGRFITAYTGHKGFPDIIAVRRDKAVKWCEGRLLFIECKSSKGIKEKLNESQQAWRDEIEKSGYEYHLVGPDDVERMMEVLK